MKSQRWILVMILLQGMILLGQWVGQPTLPTAQAQIPDAAAQRNEIIDQIRATNSKLDQLIDLLQSGNLTVKTISPADKNK